MSHPGVGVGIHADNSGPFDPNPPTTTQTHQYSSKRVDDFEPSTSTKEESNPSVPLNTPQETQPSASQEAKPLERTSTGVRTGAPISLDSNIKRKSIDRPLETQPKASGTTNQDLASSNQSQPQSQPQQQQQYPEQKHAGKVGYGPNYKPPNSGATTSEKISGSLEILKGKILHKPEVIEHGKLKKSGELSKEREEDPFKLPTNTEGTQAQKAAHPDTKPLP